MTYIPATTSNSADEDASSQAGHTKTLRSLSKLMLDIDDARKKIIRNDALMSELQNRLMNEVTPFQDQLLQIRIETFRVLAGHFKEGWLKGNQKTLFQEVLSDFADELEIEFGVDLSVERETLLGERPLTEEEAKEEAELDSEMDALFEEMFGANLGEDNPFSDESELDPFQTKKSKKPNSRKRKSKTAVKASQAPESEEQTIAGDIRALYLLLARALHPDKETDEARRTEKTGWMQKVTTAYGNRNLAELLDILACNPLDSVGPYLSQAPLKTIQGFAKRLRRELNLLRRQSQAVFYALPPQFRNLVGPTGINEAAFQSNLEQAQSHVEFFKTRLENYRSRDSIKELIKMLRKLDYEELM